MSPLSTRCIKAAWVFLAAGVGLGIAFAAQRALGATLRPLHVELNLWGWTTLLSYGMGYHMLPRFTGQPLWSPRLAEAQSWLAIGGVATAALGCLLLHWNQPGARELLIVGGGVQLCAALLFAAQCAALLRITEQCSGRDNAHP